MGPQDLSKALSPSNFNNNVAENLSMKRSPNNENINNDNMPTNLSCNNKRPDRTPSPNVSNTNHIIILSENGFMPKTDVET